MGYRRGNPTIERKNSKSFTGQQASARLKEVIASQQALGRNALLVDSYEVYLYIKQLSAKVCTCRASNVYEDDPISGGSFTSAFDDDNYSMAEDGTFEVKVDWDDKLLGDHGDEGEDVGPSELDLESDTSMGAIDSSPACGICYRAGVVPGFQQYGKPRYVFVPQDASAMFASTIVRSEHPNIVRRLTAAGFSEFELFVPKYFKTVTYSVRDNYEILNDKIYLGQVDQDILLTVAHLRQMAGKTISIRVRAEVFTHLVITFDLGTEPLLANISQLSKVTDWTNFENVGSLTAAFTMMVPDVTVGSFLIVPERNFGLRITDVPNLRPAHGLNPDQILNIEWSVSTRFMQPQEQTKNIHKGFLLI